jgi:hypothetical protein
VLAHQVQGHGGVGLLTCQAVCALGLHQAGALGTVWACWCIWHVGYVGQQGAGGHVGMLACVGALACQRMLG